MKERHELESGGVTFVFMHGHGCNDGVTLPSRMPKFVRVTISTILKFLCWVFHEDHLVIYKFLNTKIKEWKAKNLDPDQWLITGHTHYAEIDEKARYANSGLVLTNKIYNYLLIENGKITLRRRK